MHKYIVNHVLRFLASLEPRWRHCTPYRHAVAARKSAVAHSKNQKKHGNNNGIGQYICVGSYLKIIMIRIKHKVKDVNYISYSRFLSSHLSAKYLFALDVK